MAKLQSYNGRYCESEFENAFLSFLEEEGWQYLHGNSVARDKKTDVLCADDLTKFLSETNPDLTEDDVREIVDKVRLVGAAKRVCAYGRAYRL